MEELIAKYFSKEATEEESKKIEEWRNQSEENAQLFFEYKSVWAASVSINADQDKIKQITSETKVVPIWHQPWFRYAASILLVIGISLTFYFNQEKLFENNTGLVKDIRLDDGSIASLYKDASLEIVNFNESERVVRSKGKVFFNVEKDARRPFLVYTEEAVIRVLGTSFQVNSSIDHTTEVIVESGEISFGYNPQNAFKVNTSIKLAKGEKGLISPKAKGIVKQNNRDVNYLAWKTQNLSFKQDKLSYVASVLDEVYGYNIKFENKELSGCRLTAQYNRKSPEEIARLISETFGITYTVTGKNSISFSGVCN
jgi:ferric-dicitrate binding protein FerR (iron transport regulator)